MEGCQATINVTSLKQTKGIGQPTNESLCSVDKKNIALHKGREDFTTYAPLQARAPKTSFAHKEELKYYINSITTEEADSIPIAIDAAKKFFDHESWGDAFDCLEHLLYHLASIDYPNTSLSEDILYALLTCEHSLDLEKLKQQTQSECARQIFEHIIEENTLAAIKAHTDSIKEDFALKVLALYIFSLKINLLSLEETHAYCLDILKQDSVILGLYLYETYCKSYQALAHFHKHLQATDFYKKTPVRLNYIKKLKQTTSQNLPEGRLVAQQLHTM